jgi:hypothetical protein
MWALGRLHFITKWVPQATIDQLITMMLASVSSRITHYNEQGLTMICVAMAHLKRGQEEFFKVAIHHLIEINQFQGRTLSNVIWAAGVVGHHDLAKSVLGEPSIERLQNCSELELGVLSWYFLLPQCHCCFRG